MTKEDNLKRLDKYLKQLQDRKSSDEIPEKHKNRVRAYKQFLDNEIRITLSKIQEVKGV